MRVKGNKGKLNLKFSRAFKLGVWTAMMTLMLAGCQGVENAPQQKVSVVGAALSDEHRRVLGFESPTADWSSGASLSASSVVSQGSAALAADITGWTEIVSVPLSSLGEVRSDLTLDVRIPATAGWGDVRVVLTAPSLGMSYRDLGAHSLAGLTAGTYQTLTYELSSSLRETLSGAYSDLQIKIIVNGPSLGGDYLFDNMTVTAEEPDTDTGGGGATEETLSLLRPVGVTLDTLMLSASGTITVNDGATLGKGWDEDVPRGVFVSNVPPHIVDTASFGAELNEFGADVLGFTNVHSVSDVAFLRSQNHIVGFVKTEGSVLQQDNVVVDGGIFEGDTVTPVEIPWQVEIPDESGDDVYLSPDETRYLSPGAYGDLTVNARADLVLRSGTYIFDSFNTEPESQVWLNRFSGPTYIYIKEGFSYKGAFMNAGGKPEELLVGYLGETRAYIQAPMTGTIVAPNAKVELRRTDIEGTHHRCSVFAKGIEVYSNVLVEHLPFPWDDLICKDTDEDGVSDCDDLCPVNPDKIAPGICGCRVAETDSDSDGVPDCADLCPEDASKTFPGDCGCAGDAAANVGKACNDGPCVGHGVCNEEGVCDTGDTCAPDEDCVYKEFKASGYWFCPSAGDWRAAFDKCQEEPGRTLVQVDRRMEDEFLSSVASELGMTGALWTGANDRAVEGQWVWSSFEGETGTAFWNGDASGSRVLYRYEKWTGIEPDGDASENCGAMTPGVSGSAWRAEACGETFGYICEGPVGRIRLDEPYRDPKYPGTFQEDPTVCVNPENEFGTDPDAFAANVRYCQEHCQENGDGCETCQGSLAPPTDPTSRCREPNKDAEPCVLASVPADPQECDDDGDCPADQICGLYFPGERCDGSGCAVDTDDDIDWSGRRLCGYPPFNDDGESMCAVFPQDELCVDVELCHYEEADGGEVDPRVLTPEGLAEEEVTPECLGEGGDETETMPLDPPCDNPDENGVCAAGQNHNWCHFGLSNDTVDEKDDGRPKHGSSGENLISFDFDPNLNWYYDADPGPLGVTNFALQASADFTATAAFHVSSALQGEVEIVNVGASVDANQCDYYTDIHAILLGQDFTEIILANADEVIIEPKPDEEKEACHEALDDFQVSANQAKKAMKDAQELIRQYEALKQEGKQFDDLCAQIGSYPEGFDLNCDNMQNEDVIEAFIEYYENKISDIDVMRDNIAKNIAGTNGLLPIPLLNKDHEEQQNLLTMNFLIGPLPALLEVNALLGYGISGRLEVDLKGTFPKGYEKEELASVRAAVTPNADAAVSLFVGAGFSACGFSASVGIEGRVNIATLNVPFEAMTGISIQGIEDDRVPNVQSDMPGEDRPLLDIPTRYRFIADYGFGASVVVSDILAGDISLRLKIKFLFFSKTWRKRIMSFPGLVEDFTVPLLSVSDEIAAGAYNDAPWGFAEMETRFLDLRTAFEDILAADWSNGMDNGVEPVDTSRVETLFYDGLCRDCIAENETCTLDKDKLPTDASCCPGYRCVENTRLVLHTDENGEYTHAEHVIDGDPYCDPIPTPIKVE